MSLIFSLFSVFEPGIITKPGWQYEKHEKQLSQHD